VSVREVSLFSIIVAAGWPVWPLLLCSVLALALSLERLYQLRQSRVRPEALLENTLAGLERKWPGKDDIEQMANQSGLGAVLASGLRWWRISLNDFYRPWRRWRPWPPCWVCWALSLA